MASANVKPADATRESQSNGSVDVHGEANVGDLEAAQVLGRSALPDAEEDDLLVASPKAEVREQKRAQAGPPEEPTCYGVPMSWVSLIVLTGQNSLGVLTMKWARLEHLKVPYLNTTCVTFTEIVKILVSLLLVIQESGSLPVAWRSLAEHFTSKPWELAKSAIPSLIYIIQNNLMLYSLELLSAPVQQVLYQMKILTTAGLGVLMLGKKLTATQWLSLVILCVGIALVEWPRQSADHVEVLNSNSMIGFAVVLLMCLTSGFAAVFIQKMLQQSSCSIWMRNVQFGLFGAVFSFCIAMYRDGAKIRQEGFVQGYSLRAVTVIFMNAWGGIAAAVMLKYAGATLGCFSTALSIILTSVLSEILLQDFVADLLFSVGTVMAIGSTLLYGLGLPSSFVQFVTAGKVVPTQV
eukprot:TRINITY_DN2780_c0_g1_i1.p1 TRINITY_DN2780_c0_g1~~TRINITY_DN2780_c0_g1_i1.p1  ORF type:complete len:408 (-),score=58.16 TRINITY_DN2780_c0_g1_i1:252-1475(-)